MRAKLRAGENRARRRRHLPVPEQGRWLASVVRGHLAYYAVPGNIDAVGTFHRQAGRYWLRALRCRSQRHRLTWQRMSRLIGRWLPPVRIVHPQPVGVRTHVSVGVRTDVLVDHSMPAARSSSVVTGSPRFGQSPPVPRRVHQVLQSSQRCSRAVTSVAAWAGVDRDRAAGWCGGYWVGVGSRLSSAERSLPTGVRAEPLPSAAREHEPTRRAPGVVTVIVTRRGCRRGRCGLAG